MKIVHLPSTLYWLVNKKNVCGYLTHSSNLLRNRFILRTIRVFKLVTFQLQLGDCNTGSLILFIFIGVVNIVFLSSISYSPEIIRTVEIIILIIRY